MASLDWNTIDTFSYKTFIAPQVKTELYLYKDENSRYKILLLFLVAECLIIVISINKKGNFILKFLFLFSFLISFCFSPITLQV